VSLRRGRALLGPALGRQARLAALALVLGAVVGGAIVGFLALIAGVQFLAFGETSERMMSAAAALPGWRIVLAPALGGLLIGWLAHRFLPSGRIVGVPAVMLAAERDPAAAPLRAGLVSSALHAASVGVGASVGRLGPAVTLGGTIGAAAARRWVPGEDGRVLVAAAAAAGISASFLTPLAGAAMAMEVVLRRWRLADAPPILLASVVGAVIHARVFGLQPFFAKASTPRWEWAVDGAGALALGLVAALAALALMHGMMGAERLSRRVPGPRWIRPGLAGLAVGLVALAYPDVLGIGREAVDRALTGQAALAVMLAAGLAKIAATSLSIGFGFGGGVFGPGLVAGALLGGAFGAALDAAFPGAAAGPAAYAVAGMAAVAAAIVGGPISTAIIAFEMTLDLAPMPGVVLAVAVAGLVVPRLLGHRSFFAWQIALADRAARK
jgi:chloride channel protein, CIC family